MKMSDIMFFSEVRVIVLKWRMISVLTMVLISCATSLFALSINTTAPNFTLKNLEGKSVSLSDYRGKIVVLKLGTTWCPGCRDQSKELQKLDTFFKDASITVIEVFLDDPIEDVKVYQQEHTMKSAAVTLLGEDRVLRVYNVYAIPRLLILSSEQKILRDSTGMSSGQIKQIILENK